MATILSYAHLQSVLIARSNLHDYKLFRANSCHLMVSMPKVSVLLLVGASSHDVLARRLLLPLNLLTGSCLPTSQAGTLFLPLKPFHPANKILELLRKNSYIDAKESISWTCNSNSAP